MSYLVEITNKRQFKSTTGFDKVTFSALLSNFALEYEFQNACPETSVDKSYEEYLSEILYSGEEAKLGTLEEVLFFLLFQKKNDLIWDSLGFVFKMSGATAHEYYTKYLPLLESTLEKKVMPAREFETVEEFEKATENTEEVIFDGFENPKERANNYQAQKEDYSGKKKMQTDISLCMANKQRYIYYLSKYYPGSNVDYACPDTSGVF